jgi:hypothetical protein
MPLIPLLLILAASPVENQCVQKTITVCPTKKVVKKKKVIKKATTVAPCCQQPVVVNNNVYVQQAQAQSQVSLTAYEPTWASFGVRGGLGLWSCAPHYFGFVGLRAKFPLVHLGLDLTYQFNYGVGVQGLFYPIQTSFISWHLDAGILFAHRTPLSVQDVPRKLDLTVGTGLEFKVFPIVSLTADWRYSFPTPYIYGKMSGLNAANIMGNALYRSQLMLGVMLHTP